MINNLLFIVCLIYALTIPYKYNALRDVKCDIVEFVSGNFIKTGLGTA